MSGDSNSRKRQFDQTHDLNINHNDSPTKKQRITESANEYHFNNNENNSNISNITNDTNDNNNFEDEYFDKEFDDDNDYNWSDDNENDFMDIKPESLTSTDKNVSTNQSLNRTSSVQYWSCNQCNQLNNLKETFSKYDMKCFRCECDYSVKSKVIQLNEDPIQESVWKCPQCAFCNQSNVNQCKMCQESVWKCSQCTFCNQSNVNQCKICDCAKHNNDDTDQGLTISQSQIKIWLNSKVESSYDEHIEEINEIYSFTNYLNIYQIDYSKALIKQYLREIGNNLHLNKSSNLCPNILSMIPDILLMIVLRYYFCDVCDFWNVERLSSDWEFEQNSYKNRDCAANTSVLMLKPKKELKVEWGSKVWSHAFSLQKTQTLADYSWTIQIQNRNRNSSMTVISDFWIGVMEEKHETTHNIKGDLFCCKTYGFGVCAYNGYKQNEYKRERFCDPFNMNQEITVKLKSTKDYYQLLYFVNGQSIGKFNRKSKVAYRLPNDKIYEMVIALSTESLKIKCIRFIKESS